jgi:hypothetical protein
MGSSLDSWRWAVVPESAVPVHPSFSFSFNRRAVFELDRVGQGEFRTLSFPWFIAS